MHVAQVVGQFLEWAWLLTECFYKWVSLALQVGQMTTALFSHLQIREEGKLSPNSHRTRSQEVKQLLLLWSPSQFTSLCPPLANHDRLRNRAAEMA